MILRGVQKLLNNIDKDVLYFKHLKILINNLKNDKPYFSDNKTDKKPLKFEIMTITNQSLEIFEGIAAVNRIWFPLV